MIRSLLHRGARNFQRRYTYDTAYMHEVIDISTAAGVRLALFSTLSQYRGPCVAIWSGALLASTLDGDCGPCAQLVVDMAIKAGADPRALQTCAAGHPEIAGDTGLGFRFAQAAITGDPQADTLREQITRQKGPKAVLAAGFAAASGRMYPVLKRSMGHGATCQKLSFGHSEPMLLGTA